MGFRVVPERIGAMAASLDGLDTACSRAISYAPATRPPAEGGSALVRFLDATQDVEPAVTQMLAHLQEVVRASADELTRTARYYRDTDEGAAASTDAIWRSVVDG